MRNDECPRIEKDLEKLIREFTSSGSSMVHLINNAQSTTIPTVLRKYQTALGNVAKSVPQDEQSHRWFTLAIVVRNPFKVKGPLVYYQNVPNFRALPGN